MNFFGLSFGIIALFVIGLGFVWVIRGERFFGYLWWPYVMAVGGGLVLLSLFLPGDWPAALAGVLGASLVWGATELKEQAVRGELGWYPFRPKKVHPPFVHIIRRWKAPHL